MPRMTFKLAETDTIRVEFWRTKWVAHKKPALQVPEVRLRSYSMQSLSVKIPRAAEKLLLMQSLHDTNTNQRYDSQQYTGQLERPKDSHSVLGLLGPGPGAPRFILFGKGPRESSVLAGALRSPIDCFPVFASTVLADFLRSSTTIFILSPRSIEPASMAACRAACVENSTNPQDCRISVVLIVKSNTF